MLKVLIAEDEPAIRQGIIALIEGLGLQIEITGIAEDGLEALELMKIEKPDIVITDIKMPGMSGIELIGTAKKLYTDIEYIILSGYSEFEYAKQAMRYGVQDYILKPPRRDEVLGVLEKLCVSLEAVKENARKQKLFQYLVNGSKVEMPELGNAGVHFYLALICAGPFANRNENLMQIADTHWSAVEMEKQLGKGLREKEYCWVFDMKQQNEKLILLAVMQQEISPVQRMILKLTTYENLLCMPIHLILSDEIESTVYLPRIYASLHRSLGKQVLIGKSDVVFLNNESNHENELALDEGEKNKLSALLELGDEKGIEVLFHVFAEKWNKKRIPQVSCEYSVKYLFMEIFQKNPVLESRMEIEELFYQIEEVIGSTRLYCDFEEGIKKLLHQVFLVIKEEQSGKSIEDVVEMLEKHIYLHYNRNLALEEFAAQFGYSPTYLSNQFTSMKKISPSRMLTNIRLEKGKELLLNTEYLLKDIAEMLGYHDVSYFSRFFKDNVGVSPRQYREMRKSGRE